MNCKRARRPSTNIVVLSTCKGITTDVKNGNCSDSSDSSEDECVENSFSREIQEMEQLEQRDFEDEDGINADDEENS